MKPPVFWQVRQGREAAALLRALLHPLSLLYAWVTALKLSSAQPYNPGVPVVCVGALTLGGAGKTPVAIEIIRILKNSGLPVYGVSRGYGGSRAGPLLVDPDHHDAREVGDEPLLIAREARVVVGRDRAAAAQFARHSGARFLVMDDGHQNPSLQKTLSIVVIDAALGFGNGKVFPAGPLREPVAAGLARADAVVLMGARAAAADDVSGALERFHGPILEAELQPLGPPPDGPLVAFAGIGRPEKFFDALSAAGADLRDCAPFADHHPYTPGDLTLLARIAQSHRARLITTEKDALRLPAGWRAKVLVYPVQARFHDAAELVRVLSLAQPGASLGSVKPESAHGARPT